MKAWTGKSGRRYRIRKIVRYQLEARGAGAHDRWSPRALTYATQRECRNVAAVIDREVAREK